MTARRWAFSWGLVVALQACGGPHTPLEVPAHPPVEHAIDGDVRLGTEVVPSAYALDLTVDPRQETFSGRSEIAVTLKAATTRIDLHALNLTFTQVEARIGKQVVVGQAEAGTHGGLALRFATPLPAGEAVLAFAWTAPLKEVPEGLYRVKEGEDWYAFSQLEALSARAVFPCFDQPEFKTPWQVTLRVPEGQVALANAREIGRKIEAGLEVVHFAQTPPLPTYLLAFAVGPLDVVEAPAEALPGLPLRLVATRGKGVLATYALEQTPAIHQALEAWFGRPHGFDKLDLVAVPNFAAGAMENPGLVTFRETLILLDERAPAQRKVWSLSVIAHELAHQWFGDLVTLAWWNDLWLNEAFATWMAAKVVAQTHPELEADLEAVAEARYVMSLDAQQNTRAIRQPILGGGDVENAFDGITYGKGAAVLRMTENWLGSDTFRDGVRRYLNAHAGGNATTADLLASLSAASGKDVPGMLQRFLDQPGVPLVTATVVCAEGARPAVKLAQTRYRPGGSTAPTGEPWQVPVCARFGVEGTAHEQCFLLTTAEATFPLDATACPTWLHPNAHQRGYYMWNLLGGQGGPDRTVLLGSARAALSPPERVALPGVLAALLEAQALVVGPYLDALVALSADEHRIVVEGVLDGLVELDNFGVDEAQRPAFARLVQQLLRPHALRLGFTPRADEGVSDRLLRPRILNALAYIGRDESLRAQARETVTRFLADPQSVPQEQVAQALPVAAWQGDAALWTQLSAAYATFAGDPTTQSAVLRALASFEDPALFTRTLDRVLDGSLRAQDFPTVARGAGRPQTRLAGWQWLEAHYDALVQLIGRSAAPRLPMMAGGFCDAATRDRVKAFFSEPAHAPEGTERNLAQVLERIDRCIRLQAAVKAPLAAWLNARQAAEAPPPAKAPADGPEVVRVPAKAPAQPAAKKPAAKKPAAKKPSGKKPSGKPARPRKASAQ